MTKKESIRVHAKRRFVERAGVELTKALRRNLVASIRSGKAEFVERQSHRVTLFRVPVGAEKRVVVYDKTRGEIVTLLPRGAYVEGDDHDETA